MQFVILVKISVNGNTHFEHFAMRRIENGHQGLKRFLILMNHPPPMTEKNYSFHKQVKGVAEEILKDACNEVCEWRY